MFDSSSQYPPELLAVVAEVRAMQTDTSSYVHLRLGQWLVGVLLDNKRFRAEVEDVGYDVSTYAVGSSDGFHLDDYESVGDLLDNEFTGRTKATYYSGSGLAAETLYEAAVEVAEDALRDWLEDRLPGIYDFDSEDMLSAERGFDSDDLCDALSDVGSEYGFIQVFAALPLLDVFHAHFPRALALREAARQQAQADLLENRRIAALMELTGRELLTELNSKWPGRRFEKASCEDFWVELERLRASGREQNVAAALRLQGQAFSLSNSLRQEALSKFAFRF